MFPNSRAGKRELLKSIIQTYLPFSKERGLLSEFYKIYDINRRHHHHHRPDETYEPSDVRWGRALSLRSQ